MVEITDRESADAWLKTQPREAQVAFAARCALRALPVWSFSKEDATSVLVLASLRALLTASVMAVKPSNELRSVVAAVANGAIAATNANTAADLTRQDAKANGLVSARASAASAVQAIVNSAAGATAASQAAGAQGAYAADRKRSVHAISATYASASMDAGRLQDGVSVPEIFRMTLWQTPQTPEGLSEDTLRLLLLWSDHSESFGFWRRWFDGMFRGQPIDWNLQQAVALIPNDIWEAGPEAVARGIAEIESPLRPVENAIANVGATEPDLLDTSDPPLPMSDDGLTSSAGLSRVSHTPPSAKQIRAMIFERHPQVRAQASFLVERVQEEMADHKRRPIPNTEVGLTEYNEHQTFLTETLVVLQSLYEALPETEQAELSDEDTAKLRERLVNLAGQIDLVVRYLDNHNGSVGHFWKIGLIGGMTSLLGLFGVTPNEGVWIAAGIVGTSKLKLTIEHGRNER